MSPQTGAFTRRVTSKINRLRFALKVPLTPHPSMKRLGSRYGGWTFADLPELAGSQIISCGLGEDASFDVEFAAAYGANVLLVDPTPRAIEHFHRISMRLGLARERLYSGDGNQPPDSYDLSGLTDSQLMLVPKAVTDKVGTVRFYAPPDPSHVSYSVVNFQGGYTDTSPYIEVESTTFPALLELLGEASVPLVKFDIEGAEISVIPQMLTEGIRPSQILVEFDELAIPSQRALARFRGCHEQLTRAGYLAAHMAGNTDFLYVQSSRYPPTQA